MKRHHYLSLLILCSLAILCIPLVVDYLMIPPHKRSDLSSSLHGHYLLPPITLADTRLADPSNHHFIKFPRAENRFALLFVAPAYCKHACSQNMLTITRLYENHLSKSQLDLFILSNNQHAHLFGTADIPKVAKPYLRAIPLYQHRQLFADIGEMLGPVQNGTLFIVAPSGEMLVAYPKYSTLDHLDDDIAILRENYAG